MHVADPRYELPGRRYFAKLFVELYDKTKEDVSARLKCASFFSATTDLWSSRTMQPYMSLTVHFITDEWKLENICLQTSFFPDDHTGWCLQYNNNGHLLLL